MAKIIKKADVYLKIDNDTICHTIDVSEFNHITGIINNIRIKIDQIYDTDTIKLESIYFREEEIKE